MPYFETLAGIRSTALIAALAIVLNACASAPAAPTATAPAAASTATAPAAAPAATAAPVQPVEVSVSLPVLNIPDYLPLFVGRAKGYFEEEKIIPKFILMSGTAAAQALVSGGLDLSASSGTAMNGIMAGLPLKAIAATNVISVYRIYSNDPAVKTLKDLEGRTFGVPDLRDTRHESALVACQSEGVDCGKIQFVQLGAGNALAALIANRVAATSLLDIEWEKFLTSPGVKPTVLIDLNARKIPILSGGLAASDAGIKAKGDAYVRFLRAYLKGVRYTQAYIGEAAKIMAEQPEVKGLVTAQLLQETGKRFWIDSPPPATLSIAPEVQAKMVEIKRLLVPTALAGIGPQQVFDYSMVQKAYDTLIASGWKPTGP